MLLKDITAKRIEEYASWRRNDVKGTTVNKELSTIRTMFDKAVDWNFIAANPARKVKELPDDSAIHDRYLKPLEFETCWPMPWHSVNQVCPPSVSNLSTFPSSSLWQSILGFG
jgi:hypothetical protein